MPYVGNIPAEKYASFEVQHFTTSATTSYTLTHAVANELDIRLVINTVIQQPGGSYSYTAAGTTLTLSAATAGTDTMYCVYIGKAVQTVVPGAGTVSTTALVDESVNEAKLKVSNSPTNGYVLSAQSGASGGLTWAAETAPTISSISPTVIENTASAITITGTNFVSVPTVDAISSTGAIITADAVSFTSSTSISATFTLPIDGNYYIRVENSDGNAVRSSSTLLSVSDVPAWTTGSGTLGTLVPGTTVNITVAATGDTVAYSETTSVLTSTSNTPTSTMSLTLNSSTGVIGGTCPSPSGDTTYNFTLRATDAQAQTADRAFSISVLSNYYGDGSDGSVST
jgi:hypothetical protein